MRERIRRTVPDVVTLHPAARIALQAAGVIAFAAVFVVAAVFLDDYSRTHWVPPAGSVRMLLFTYVTFIAVTMQFRRDWRRSSFWLVMSAVLLTHVIFYTALLSQLPTLPLAVFAAMSLLEIPVLCALLGSAGFRS